MNPSTSAALRSEGHRSIVVIRNYRFDPITAVSCRAKKHALRPRQSYFAPAPSRAALCFAPPRVEAPGTAPGSDRFITEFVYRHNRRKRRQYQYMRSNCSPKGATGKADTKSANGGLALDYSVRDECREPSWRALFHSTVCVQNCLISLMFQSARVRCSATWRSRAIRVQNVESKESLPANGCRTKREMALLSAIKGRMSCKVM